MFFARTFYFIFKRAARERLGAAQVMAKMTLIFHPHMISDPTPIQALPDIRNVAPLRFAKYGYTI